MFFIVLEKIIQKDKYFFNNDQYKCLTLKSTTKSDSKFAG